MTQPPPKRIFPTSKVDARAAQHVPSIPQTESAAYKLAFQDTDFLLREDLRPVRFQLELLKPELLLNEAKIESTMVFYGSARIPSPDMADALIEAATNDQQQAQYIVQAYQMAKSQWPWMGAMFLWNLNYQTIPGIAQGDEKYGWGVLRPDLSPRPAYTAIQQMPK